MFKPPTPGETGRHTPETHAMLAALLETQGAQVTRDVREAREVGVFAFVATFHFKGAKTTLRIVLGDPSGADVTITNMTTLPHTATAKVLEAKLSMG